VNPINASMVRLHGNRQPAEKYVDQFRSPNSRLNFEPFAGAVRPNSLRADNQSALQTKSETLSRPQALLQRSRCRIEHWPHRRGSETQTAFLTSDFWNRNTTSKS